MFSSLALLVNSRIEFIKVCILVDCILQIPDQHRAPSVALCVGSMPLKVVRKEAVKTFQPLLGLVLAVGCLGR